MMATSEDHIALAAEYALGTLDADERAQAEAMMAADRDFAAMVEAWSTRLGALNQMVGSVEPSAEVWERIRVAAGLSGAQLPLVLPEAPGPIEPAPVETAPVIEPGNVVAFPAQTRRWRNIATVMTAIAAALIAIVVTQVVRPDLLPAGIRPTLASYDTDIIKAATYAVTVEPSGGSPDGKPTLPPLFAGKLIETVPQASTR